jgi:hypothetical protein
MRRLGVGFETYINHAEDHPLAIGRDFRLAYALELHHVFEGEGMLGLGEGGKSENDKGKKNEKETAHDGLSSANG